MGTFEIIHIIIIWIKVFLWYTLNHFIILHNFKSLVMLFLDFKLSAKNNYYVL